jgi:hypothetical protein
MPRLCMHFLGTYQLQRDGEPVTTLQYDKVRALLAYLAMQADRPHRREALVGLLWPDLPERQALLTLRRALGDEEPASFLAVTPHAIQFDAASDAWIDVSAFASLLAQCRAHSHWRLETCPTAPPSKSGSCCGVNGCTTRRPICCAPWPSAATTAASATPRYAMPSGGSRWIPGTKVRTTS